MNKNHSQVARLGFAVAGFKRAWVCEASFRTEIIVGVLVLVGLALWQPARWCWLAALFSLMFVLTAELINTAIENICDALHPEEHPLIKIAKDCASAAVLMANTNGLLVVIVILWWGKS